MQNERVVLRINKYFLGSYKIRELKYNIQHSYYWFVYGTPCSMFGSTTKCCVIVVMWDWYPIYWSPLIHIYKRRVWLSKTVTKQKKTIHLTFFNVMLKLFASVFSIKLIFTGKTSLTFNRDLDTIELKALYGWQPQNIIAMSPFHCQYITWESNKHS